MDSWANEFPLSYFTFGELGFSLEVKLSRCGLVISRMYVMTPMILFKPLYQNLHSSCKPCLKCYTDRHCVGKPLIIWTELFSLRFLVLSYMPDLKGATLVEIGVVVFGRA